MLENCSFQGCKNSGVTWVLIFLDILINENWSFGPYTFNYNSSKFALLLRFLRMIQNQKCMKNTIDRTFRCSWRRTLVFWPFCPKIGLLELKVPPWTRLPPIATLIHSYMYLIFSCVFLRIRNHNFIYSIYNLTDGFGQQSRELWVQNLLLKSVIIGRKQDHN